NVASGVTGTSPTSVPLAPSQPFPPPSSTARRAESQHNLALIIGFYVACVFIIGFGFLRTLMAGSRDRMFVRYARRHPTKTSTTSGKRKPSMFSRMIARVQAYVTLPALFGGRH